MTLVQPPLMVTGAAPAARAVRLMISDLARGGQGIAAPGDLKVSPLDTPGPGVRVGDGSAVIHGARPWQGAYTQSNVGDARVDVPGTGPTARTDLLILRVEDPDYEGSRDPRRDDVGYFHLLQGVAADTVSVPPGVTGIPLARITQPRNTAAITSGMITDLRQLANPRTQRTVRTIRPAAAELPPGDHGRWTTWPKDASWDIGIPAWATKAAVLITMGGLRLDGGGVYAELRTTLGELHGGPAVIDDDQGKTARRTVTVLADAFDVPAHYRGTRQHLGVQTNQNTAYGPGHLATATGTTITFDVQFSESPV
ncbi:hypothetical protein K7472_08015 [Streptomyces sp. PTM05]|uniref:Minor tail protein n=1 Tax=Streptantibioticus parmotrematis TaxID=2873249 RepID=A0ABS7QQZ2_9ACTN|nr:hypothetical protein [Streptantibioticus parmotrematis]MBY8884790.1 hypothetical protein [Streptantibioticus parmotrematis]